MITNIEEYQKLYNHVRRSQEFRFKNMDETKNYLIEEINQNQLMSKKDKTFYRVFNYIEHLLILISTLLDAFFPSLIGISIGITSSAIRLNIFVATAGITKC